MIGRNNVDAEDRADAGLDFPGCCRLHTAADFSRVFAARRVLRGEYFDLHYLAVRPEVVLAEAGARLGLVIAKKLARRAVQRNLLKRLAREAFRHSRSGLPAYDLVLRLARSPISASATPARPAPVRSLSQYAETPDQAALRHAWRMDIDRLLARLMEQAQRSKEGERAP